METCSISQPAQAVQIEPVNPKLMTMFDFSAFGNPEQTAASTDASAKGTTAQVGVGALENHYFFKWNFCINSSFLL